MSDLSKIFLQAGDAIGWAGLVLSPLLVLPFIVLLMPKATEFVSRPLSAAIDRISGVAMGIAVFSAVALVFSQIAVIVLLSVFGVELKKLSEGVIYFFAIVFMLGAAATLRDDGHVRVDIFLEKMSPKQRASVDLFGIYVFLLPMMVLILTSVRPSLTRAWSQFEPSSEAAGLPIYFLFKTLVPVFAALVLVQGLSVALKAARTIRGRDQGTAAHHGAEGL